MHTLLETDYTFACPFTKHRGKVRDVYTLSEQLVLLVATDRLSAFDHQLRQLIPHKGQVLNQLAVYFLESTEELVPNHLVAIPHANAVIGLRAKPYPVEVIVRGYLAGSAWRLYREGAREICGVRFPDGLRENDPLPEPVLTPSTKSQHGPDINITEAEITKSNLVPADEWLQIKAYAMALFAHGQAHAASRGLILADTKYEFGHTGEGDVLLIDEVHTPDSSRYFFAEGFAERQARGEPQPHFSKEFARQWLIEHGFMGKPGQALPDLPEDVVVEIRRRYVEVFETLTGQPFVPMDAPDLAGQIRAKVAEALHRLGVGC